MELPDLSGRREIVRRYARLVAQFSDEIGERPLVLQNGEFFPDAFHRDEPSTAQLVRRMQGHAGLDDVPIEVRVSEDATALAGGSCSSGGCAPSAVRSESGSRRLLELDDGWRIELSAADLQHPVALTTHLARTLGLIFLMESSDGATRVDAPLEVSADLASVALGLGSLVLEGSYVYAKSCGGPSVAQLTALSVAELSVACSLFLVAGGHSPRRMLATLGTTQRALLSEADAWARSNGEIVRKLCDSPEEVESRLRELRDTRPWLSRLFDGKKKTNGELPSLEQALAGGLSDDELRKFAGTSDANADASRPGNKPDAGASRMVSDEKRREIQALVDEALGSS